MPFYAWQCLSLRLSHRDVDIVIKNQKDQNNFVKYLIYNMNTSNGYADSAIPLLERMEQEGIN